MKKFLNIIVSFFEKIIGIINIVLIVVIVLNVIYFIFSAIDTKGYISFLDYSYQIIEEDNDYLDLSKGDFLLIDLKVSPDKDDDVMYEYNNDIEIGKIIDSTPEHVTISNGTVNTTAYHESVIGKVIKVIPNLGTYLNSLLKTNILLISIGILIVTSIIQTFLSKKKQKLKQSKPDFSKYNNV